jgi:uncharacterized membrane protein YcaP (DUF421 family)
MKKEQIEFPDWKRLFLGDTPPEFMVEVLFRTVLIYLFLLLVVRLLGKRMNGQLTIAELAVMVTLGGIVSPAMQLPDRGLLFGVLALLCALIFQRFYTLWTFKSEKMEKLSQGEMSVLVKDGVLQLDEMENARITRQQLYGTLRSRNIFNLGEIKRVYMEGCGIFSIYKTDGKKPGLPILPSDDQEILTMANRKEDSVMACCNCGHVQQITSEETRCDVCNEKDWTKAFEPKD